MKTTIVDFKSRVLNFLTEVASNMPCAHLKFFSGVVAGRFSNKISESLIETYGDSDGLIDMDALHADITNGFKALDSSEFIIKPAELFPGNAILEILKPLDSFKITKADIDKYFF